MSECRIGDSLEGNEGLKVARIKRIQSIENKNGYDEKLARLIIINKNQRKKRIALVVNSIMGVVTAPEEGITLINQLYKINIARLSNFDITNLFIT